MARVFNVGLNRIRASQHRPDQIVDVEFSVSPISSHLERMTLGIESSSGTSKLEGPQEVVGFLEVLTTAGDLVNEILNGVNVVLSEGLLDKVV